MGWNNPHDPKLLAPKQPNVPTTKGSKASMGKGNRYTALLQQPMPATISNAAQTPSPAASANTTKRQLSSSSESSNSSGPPSGVSRAKGEVDPTTTVSATSMDDEKTAMHHRVDKLKQFADLQYAEISDETKMAAKEAFPAVIFGFEHSPHLSRGAIWEVDDHGSLTAGNKAKTTSIDQLLDHSLVHGENYLLIFLAFLFKEAPALRAAFSVAARGGSFVSVKALVKDSAPARRSKEQGIYVLVSPCSKHYVGMTHMFLDRMRTHDAPSCSNNPRLALAKSTSPFEEWDCYAVAEVSPSFGAAALHVLEVILIAATGATREGVGLNTAVYDHQFPQQRKSFEIYAKSLFKAVYAHIDGGGLIPPSPNPSGSGYSSPREQTAPAEWMRLFGPVTDYLVPPALMYDMIRGGTVKHITEPLLAARPFPQTAWSGAPKFGVVGTLKTTKRTRQEDVGEFDHEKEAAKYRNKSARESVYPKRSGRGH